MPRIPNWLPKLAAAAAPALVGAAAWAWERHKRRVLIADLEANAKKAADAEKTPSQADDEAARIEREAIERELRGDDHPYSPQE